MPDRIQERMKPYYEHAGITIYHGDCRDILPGIKADFVLTDPPYGVGMDSFADDFELVELLSPQAIFARGLACFMAPTKIALAIELLHPWMYANCLWWWKVSDIAHPWHGWHQNAEVMLLFVNDKPFPKARVNRPNTYELMVNGKEVGHPCAKPLEMIRHCILNLTDEADLIVDPFAGSGSTLVGAKMEGRSAIGIEIEEKYCEIAAKRLSQEVFQF